MYSSYSFTTSELDGVSGQRHSSAALYPQRKDPHWTGGWVDPIAVLDTEVRGKISCLCRGSNFDRPVVQSVARHHTYWATPAQESTDNKRNIMRNDIFCSSFHFRTFLLLFTTPRSTLQIPQCRIKRVRGIFLHVLICEREANDFSSFSTEFKNSFNPSICIHGMIHRGTHNMLHKLRDNDRMTNVAA
jgi:hypothetical protein